MIGSSSTVSQTASTLPSTSALFLLGASSMKTIFRSSPSAAAAEPGWVVSPPLPTTSARCPGHCDSATVTVRRPRHRGDGGAAGVAAGVAVGGDAGAVAVGDPGAPAVGRAATSDVCWS